MVVGESKRTANIMDGIENTGDVRLHDHRLRLKQRFDIVRKLGQGTYGKVQLGINKKTGQEVAIKTIKKCKIETEADLIRIRREVQIMSSVRHPNIVHIYEVFENSEKMILVMEYCSGGELYDYLSQKKVLEEDEARRLFRQIATAVYYCHIHKICHRDLKLENVLLDDTGSAKIADFGLSNVFKETSLLSTFCGSPLYASPEIVKGTPYIGPEVDCWSLGVLLYTLVYGAMPFDGSNFKRLVRQISNGDYYEPKSPSTASPLIRDMLTVDPLKRADIAYICDHPWVNTGCEASCLEVAEALAAQTPVRLDLLLSLAPAAPSSGNSVLVPAQQSDLGPEESCTDLTSSTSMAVEPSNSAEKRILELVAEGGEDAIKPSPTRTLVSAADNKRKLDAAASASCLRKKERVASCASMAPLSPALPEEDAKSDSPPPEQTSENSIQPTQPTLKSSATMTISPAPAPPVKEQTEVSENVSPEELKEKPRLVIKKKVSPTKSDEKSEKLEETKDATKTNAVSSAAEQLTSLSLAQPKPTPAPAPAPAKPKKLSIPGGHVGSFKEQFERRASLTAAPEIKRNVSKPVVSKLAKPKAQSEDRELKSPDNGTVRLQQIGIEPSPVASEREGRGGVKKTESEPSHSSAAVDPSELLQDARRSLQNSMAKLAEERAGEDSRRRAARDIISSAIRTGKPPVPYGRSSSAGVATLLSPPGTPGSPAPAQSPRVFRTEAQHRVEDHRNRGVSVERIIPITMSGEEPPARAASTTPTSPATPATSPPASLTSPVSPISPAGSRATPLRRLASVESTSEAASPSSGEPIKKSAREFIIPIAVEGKGYVTPRQRSLEPDALPARLARAQPRPRRISSLVSGGESEEEDDTHMHRLRSTRAARAESVSSGEEDEEDEGFHLLTAENLFSTLLHRVRALTQRLNGEEGPGFQHPHSLFNNLQSPFFNSPHLPRRNLLREGWGSRELHAPFDSVFGKRPAPRGSSKKTAKHQTRASPDSEARVADGLDLSDLDLSSIEFSEREMRALSGLTPALSRRLQRQLLAHLPPRAAARLRRTLSLTAAPPHPAPHPAPDPARSRSASTALERLPDDSGDSKPDEPRVRLDDPPVDNVPKKPIDEPSVQPSEPSAAEKQKLDHDTLELSASQFCTLPRLRRRKTQSREPESPPSTTEPGIGNASKLESLIKDSDSSKTEHVQRFQERPLLSKYLAPEKYNSLDETSYLSEGSILSEPSYIAAYGSPAVLNTPVSSFRHHSLRLSGDQSKKRISRFLRSDFFDTPPDESLYAKHKKEKELETQKILKEIREKKNKSLNTSAKSPIETNDLQFTSKDESSRKCLSPITNSILKDRSRSNTPFFPILDNIKETNLDSSVILPQTKESKEENETKSKTNSMYLDSKLSRPKSYPIKNIEKYDSVNKNATTDSCRNDDNEVEDKKAGRESKLIRPKSYPTSNPSPEKVYTNRNSTKEELKSSKETDLENKTDIEVSFSITLPKKPKSIETESQSKQGPLSSKLENKIDSDSTLTLKKYKVINSKEKNEKVETPDVQTNNNTELKNIKNGIIKDDVKPISTENQTNDKKGVTKKKVIKKVSSKSKTDINVVSANESKSSGDKKKVIKKVKEKDKNIDDNTPSVPKKKSVLQSIGHKLEKLASSKSNSPEKVSNNSIPLNNKNDSSFKQNRNQREHSVPANIETISESNFIKRAVTITDVAALENPNNDLNKTTVSKVLGLFKRFEPKEKNTKTNIEKNSKESDNNSNEYVSKKENTHLNDSEGKPKRPNSLLLNGLGRKNKFNRSSSEDNTVTNIENSERQVLKKENDSKPTLKLDFSRLPRVKKIVPTNSVIEPQIMSFSNDEKYFDKSNVLEKNEPSLNIENKDSSDTKKRSRSRSRSIYSNSDIKSETSPDIKDKHSSHDGSLNLSYRNHESISPEKEDILDRIRRKSFYSRFNEKKQRRKSSLVGPGATEYDPLARIHSHATESKYDVSPTSPGNYDLSPGLSVGSDLSPSTERYRSLLNDLPITTRTNLKYDGINDKIDMYRSLDRKYSGIRSYLDYDQPSSYNSNRYSRTKSLFEGSDLTEDQSYGLPRESHKYSRTNSLFSPGSYATYRPKRTRNSAIILKESEKEPSPENILDKIRQRKISISVTRKPDHEKESVPRSNVTPKSEGDGSERSAKID